MSYKIVVDSCCDLPEELRKDGRIQKVPLTIHIDDQDVVDDETFDQAAFLKLVKQSENCPKTSCPSPGAYLHAIEGEEQDIYVVTLSANLSGSYQSAQVGKNMYYEDHGLEEKNIYIFDSCSASGGEALIAMKILELAEKGTPFTELVSQVEDFRYEMDTYFVIENLDTLRKNGRLTGLRAVAASVLNIKPVMGADKEGNIIKLDQARGIQRALTKMVAVVAENVRESGRKTLAISQCNCQERAEQVKEMLRQQCEFARIIIVQTGGISTCYANDGGIIVTV